MQPTITNPTQVSLKELLLLQGHAAGMHIAPNQRATRQLSGTYRSSFRGRGMEFDETRLYLPGDDIRAIDWRVTARTDKPHTKVFREERERPVMLVVDTGSSMQFGTRVAFKSVVAAQVAALLGWGAALAGDRVGFLLFDGDEHQECKPQKGKKGLLAGLKFLSQPEPTHAAANTGAELNKALHRVEKIAKHGCLIYLMSDFLHLDDATLLLLRKLAMHNELVLIQILDPLELQLPSTGKFWVSNRQSRLQLDAADPHTRQFHQQLFPRIAQALKTFSLQHGIHYFPLMTNDPLVQTLRTRLFSGKKIRG